MSDALGAQLIDFVRVLRRARARYFKTHPDGLEETAFAILAHLVERPQRISTLADELQSDISSISRQTSSLVRLGLIQRLADPTDGRVCVLAPTGAGRQVFDHARDARNRWLAGTVRDWNPNDVKQLTVLLGRLNADLMSRDARMAEPGGSE